MKGIDENGQIINVSDQLLGFANEMAENIEELMKSKKLDRQQAEKCIELAIQNVRNDVIWKRLKTLNDISEQLNNIAIYISDSIEK